MRLNPEKPPGRSTRKALAFAAEIGRLHVEGYSCEAIRQALAVAGVEVSRSTVIREVALYAKTGAPRFAPGQAGPIAQSPAARATTQASLPASSDRRSGKEVAAAWMKDRITNPLLRARINDESSGH